VRELEQVEAEISAGGLLLPRQLEARTDTITSLRGDLEELLAMKSVLLRTLQKNVASEYLDIEMQHQRCGLFSLQSKLAGLTSPLSMSL
jgi:hypothetical protein